jgi:hypothetical protein
MTDFDCTILGGYVHEAEARCRGRRKHDSQIHRRRTAVTFFHPLLWPQVQEKGDLSDGVPDIEGVICYIMIL